MLDYLYCLIYFDFLSVDPDGDSVTKGIDTDFDGVIDIPVDVNYGFTIASIDSSLVRSIWNGMNVYEGTCDQIDLAFIAVDEHGASTSEFMHFIGTGSCEGPDNDGGDDDFLMMYAFSERDASGAMGETTDDNLVHVAMTQGSNLDWSLVRVTIVVDGGSSITCSQTSGSSPCLITYDTTDTIWDVGEEFTIVENGADLCDGSSSGGCDIDITITKIGVGGDSDKVIAMISAFADGAQ